MRVPFVAIIPARMASTRLPGKPLADIAGKPMVVRVAEQALASGAAAVYVATDHAAVASACAAHDVACVMTRANHATGTDRLAEVVAELNLKADAIVVNVQGDEPLVAPALIRAVAVALESHPEAAIATASHAIRSAEEFFNPNVVKVVCDKNGLAHYFSRAPIPFAREHFAKDKNSVPHDFIAQRHIGLYAYRVSFLTAYASLSPAPEEQVEALEQLRALHHGYRIVVHNWGGEIAPGVDTSDDLARVQALAKARYK